jgi:hypothetical protein
VQCPLKLYNNISENIIDISNNIIIVYVIIENWIKKENMSQEELQISFDKYKNLFDTVKLEIENKIVKFEHYKGEFYEITPYSYQRGGFKQGIPVKNINLIKSTKNLYTYGFNQDGKIIEIREGISLKDAFYYQFLFYEKDCIKSLSYDNVKSLRNISFYIFDGNNRISRMYLKGKRGGREEVYNYSKNDILEKIVIKQFDKESNEADTLIHSFEYDINGELKSIIKTAMNNDTYSEILYSTH